MPRTTEPLAARVLAALRALAVVVEDATGTAAGVVVPSYPGGRRPSATVVLAGGGARGAGEHVAWVEEDHARLCARLDELVPHGRWRLGEWADTVAGRTERRYERAALEAAAIDLALRQAGTNLFRLAGVPPRPVRYVVSFDRRADPAAEARRVRSAGDIELKIDADPAWDDRVYSALAAAGGVAIVDFKGDGTAADHARALRALPEALLEDPGSLHGPWSADVRKRLALDAAVQQAADVDRLPVRPAAVNVKPGRLGGVLEALVTSAACERAGIPIYFGGMFEVGVGRRQLHALAALLAPDGPNDVAPIAVGDAPAARPPRLAVDPDAPGFGSTLDSLAPTT